MKITSAEFVISAVKPSQCPKDGLPEIALIGRSNVGKSSLINTFVNRKSLAKTSSQPGKTRLLNFYRVNGMFYLVDLPGFGYAKVPVEVKKGWERMVGEYIETRPGLKGALVVLDPRRDLGDTELNLFGWLSERSIPFRVVFTKSDKLSRNELSSRLATIKRSRDTGKPVVFSSHTGEGRILLGKAIDGLLSGED